MLPAHENTRGVVKVKKAASNSSSVTHNLHAEHEPPLHSVTPPHPRSFVFLQELLVLWTFTFSMSFTDALWAMKSVEGKRLCMFKKAMHGSLCRRVCVCLMHSVGFLIDKYANMPQ